MSTTTTTFTSTTTPTQFVDVGGRRLAYRSVGEGKPLVLCHRFRGVLDLWDPAFLDALAARGFRVITFDYSGLGQSTGEPTYKAVALAKDAKDLVDALGLTNIVIGGWSLGGIAAQVYLAMFGSTVSHVLLLATTPPGTLVKAAEQLFFEVASQPGATLEQFTTLFFEGKDARSRDASKRSFERIAARRADRSPDVPAGWAIAQIGSTPANPVFPSEDVLCILQSTSVPILHVGADHDIIFPVENWYALSGRLPTLQLVTFPRAGHGAHHQHPVAAASHIASFVHGEG
ncbi:MAG: alpha/beta hydrolase [Deltaproteobacteria bacterium]|nr:alpha/beta hydrolase [Deltaproteobacteria bacterium]